jgi:hypothetical protein
LANCFIIVLNFAGPVRHLLTNLCKFANRFQKHIDSEVCQNARYVQNNFEKFAKCLKVALNISICYTLH